MGFKNLDLNNKIKWGLGFSLCILIISSIVSFYTIRNLIEQSKLVAHTNNVILNLEKIISCIKDSETGQRGYLLTFDKRFLKPYYGSKQQAQRHFDFVRSMTKDNPEQQSNLDSLQLLIDHRYNKLEERLKKTESDKVAFVDSLIEGQVLMDKCRQKLQQMHAEELRLLLKRTEATDKAAYYSPILITISSIISILLASFSIIFIIRDIKKKEEVQKELTRFNYLLQGNTELNDLLREEKELSRAADKILNHLREKMKAQAGVLYILGDDYKYHLTGSFALDSDDSIPLSFKEGESLLGQAALKKETIILDQIPKESIKIRSGLTLIEPVNLLIAPFYHHEKTTAIIELVSKSTFEEVDLEYLNSIGNTISIFINNLKSETRTIELLSETQSQAEELESQQEELRLVNDELREQRDRLQASEEEIKASEEELQEKNSELELQYEAIKIKNQELENAKQAVQLKVNQVETVSKYKSDFLANMSHELRTPLNSILILSALLKDNKNVSAKEAEQARIIEKSGNDLLKLINEILDLARVESGKIKLEMGNYVIQDFNLENQFKEFAKERIINFSVVIDSNLSGTIYTDRFRVEQILRNLLSNAFKFTPQGGSITYHIGFAESNQQFKHVALQNSKVIAFSVKDTGVGIPQEKLQIIFEAFQQADPSTTRKYGGSGLGLTISRDIANLLGGEIHVESEVGKGSTFTLYLPEKIEDTVAEIPMTNTTQVSEPLHITLPVLKNKEDNSLLIIEDDVYFSKILADYASSKGFTVKIAHTGKDGLAILANESFAAVLVDVQLPDLNGWEVLKIIKNNPSLKSTPVHMMSAYHKEGNEDHGQADFIPKPMTLEKLDKAFEEIARKKSLKKVLVVEDNENENLAIQELLKSQQIESESAYLGKEALEKLTTGKYDCIILDINLPDLTGHEVLAQIKANDKIDDVPIIIYSGKDLSEDEEALLKKHVDTIIIKTEYSYNRLLEEVKLFMHNMSSTISKSLKSRDTTTDTALLNKKVLIVDDDMRNIFSLSSILEDQGMRILVAYDGNQAIQELSANQDTDIVLMDIMMPELDGIEATKIIKSKPELRNIPIIAVTAKAMEGDKERCLEAGVSDYISKPIDINKLLSLIRVWIYKS